MDCKFCGEPLLPGTHGKREFCRDAHRQAYYRQKQQGRQQQTTAQAQETNKLQATISDLEDTIAQLKSTIRTLEINADLEHRYYQDTQARGFIAFLRQQPRTPLIERLLTNEQFTFVESASHYTYESRLGREGGYSVEDFRQIKELWKLLLLTLDRKKHPFSTIEEQPSDSDETSEQNKKGKHTPIINLATLFLLDGLDDNDKPV